MPLLGFEPHDEAPVVSAIWLVLYLQQSEFRERQLTSNNFEEHWPYVLIWVRRCSSLSAAPWRCTTFIRSKLSRSSWRSREMIRWSWRAPVLGWPARNADLVEEEMEALSGGVVQKLGWSTIFAQCRERGKVPA